MKLSRARFERKANSEFWKFARKQEVDDLILKRGIRKCEHVRRFLEKQLKSIDVSTTEYIYGGSFAKRVDVQRPELDIVFKVAKKRPPFTDILDCMKTALKQYAIPLAIRPQSVSKSITSVQFSFFNGAKVEMMPAEAKLSHEEVLREVQKRPRKNRRYWSGTLVEGQTQLLKQQNEYAFAMARIARYWFKCINFRGAYIAGGSTIFELLAVAAVHQLEVEKEEEEAEDDDDDDEDGEGEDGDDEEEDESEEESSDDDDEDSEEVDYDSDDDETLESLIHGFVRMVKLLESLARLELEFKSGSYPAVQVSVCEISDTDSPYIIEPVHPKRNLLEGLSSNVKETLKRNAAAMKQRLIALIKKREYCSIDMTRAKPVRVDFNRLLQGV